MRHFSVLLLLLLAACDVPRAEPTPVDVAGFPAEQNLLRGREALQDRIAEEKEHVEALKVQLAGLQDEEERLYATFLKAESDYQLREKDVAGVEQDLATAQKALADTQAKVVEVQAQLAASQVKLADLVAHVQAILDALAKLEAALAAGKRDELAALIAQIPPQLLPPIPPEPAPAPAPGGGGN
jgi:flagellar motility protein MotE (MotC chaperone)